MITQIFQRTDFELEIAKEAVFRIMDCHIDSPVYDVVEEAWDECGLELCKLISPAAVISLADCDRDYDRKDLKESSRAIFVLQTVGASLSERSSELFADGDALGGMMADAIADVALGSLDEQVHSWLKDICSKEKVGILRRLEGVTELPIEAQQWILEQTEGEERLGVSVTSGYMYHPVKSIGYVLVTTENTAVFKVRHNCRNCNRTDCNMRTIQPVQIQLCDKDTGKELARLVMTEEESIMSSLRKADLPYSFPCAGKGICGKCRIRLIDGELPITAADIKFFTEEELEDGFRLACMAYPKDDVTISYCGEEGDDFEVLSLAQRSDGVGRLQAREGAAAYNIAIDIGTTTIAVSLVQTKELRTICVHTSMNRQRKFGTDVLARIQASNEGQGAALRRCVQEDLLEGIEAVLAESGIDSGEVGMIAIAGNTTMRHLLMGLSCETLGVYPFTPVDISMRTLRFEEVFESSQYSFPVLLIAGISTYVGADITAGMLYCGFAKRDEVCMLIDLGTNGEMAIGNRDRILVTSTAAGPAFEGGNISCGVGSIAGAISDVHIQNGKAEVTTIADKQPIGICGTGAIAIVSELLREGILEDTGLLDEDYFEDGFCVATGENGSGITFTQKDIREMQLAKAAVRAGLETLLLRFGVDASGVDRVYLAGGFGYKMDLDKAAAIGLLPRELLGKIEAVGNSSLGGAVMAILQEGAEKEIENICSISEEVSLSSDSDFGELYMEYMMFEA